MRGGSPATTWRSEPLRMCMLRRKSLISDMPAPGSTAVAAAIAGAGACGSCDGRGAGACGSRDGGGAGARRGLCRAHAARQHGRIGHEPLELLAIRRIAVRVVGIDE